MPRPDWYFYFLFYLLRIFKWPESVVLGTVGIPTLLLILMFLLPFVDRRRERRLLRRPVAVVAALLVIASMGILTYKGATAEESLASRERRAASPSGSEQQGLSEAGRPRAPRSSRESGCMNCHTYLGAGSSNLGAPDLTDDRRTRPRRPRSSPLRSPTPVPSSATPGSMPAFANFSDEQYQLLSALPRGVEGRRAAASSGRRRRRVHIFLGITGASGAPYAARLLQALAASGAEVGLCISDAGVQVLRDRALRRPRACRARR